MNASAALDQADPTNVASVQLFGVSPAFWDTESIKDLSFWTTSDAVVVVNQTLADDLKLKAGDTMVLNVQKSEAIPRESLLGKRKSDDVIESLTVKVQKILPMSGMARFALRPSPEPPKNAFVPLGYLQKQLNLSGKANLGLLKGDVAKVSLDGRLGQMNGFV